ncbi:hypothetical protein Tco_1333189, partial [Tanacetum coccineum]
PHKGVQASASSDVMYSFTSAQDGDPLQDDVRLCLGDDLKKAQDHRYTTMCNTAKEIWKTLLITHQGNSQVKDNKINLLVQQYEQFIISEDKSIDSVFARFNIIITSLKALDEGYSSKNYVRKFLRSLHPKWRAKVTAIKESKDLMLETKKSRSLVVV